MVRMVYRVPLNRQTPSNPPTLNSDFKFIKKQKIEPPYRLICGLGASVGCEYRGDYSTRRNKSHR